MKKQICSHCKKEITRNKTLKVKALNIEVETEISQKGKSFNKLVISKGWRLLTLNEIVYLYNNHAKELNMLDTWEFFEQPFKLNKEKGYVARFVADSGGSCLGCYWDPDSQCASLGVRFARSLK